MAILKHIASKNSDYSKALEYLMFEHDEKTGRTLRDENGKMIPAHIRMFAALAL